MVSDTDTKATERIIRSIKYSDNLSFPQTMLGMSADVKVTTSDIRLKRMYDLALDMEVGCDDCCS